LDDRDRDAATQQECFEFAEPGWMEIAGMKVVAAAEAVAAGSAVGSAELGSFSLESVVVVLGCSVGFLTESPGGDGCGRERDAVKKEVVVDLGIGGEVPPELALGVDAERSGSSSVIPDDVAHLVEQDAGDVFDRPGL